jgi:hypothetical protein
LLVQPAEPQQDAPLPGERSRELIQPVGRVEAAKHQLQLDPPPPLQAQKLSFAAVRTEADELSKLAQSLPQDIEQIARGKMPKDTAEKLKRIEKLSKQLRGQLNP